MKSNVFYSDDDKEKFLIELEQKGHSIISVEQDFVGVWTVKWCY